MTARLTLHDGVAGFDAGTHPVQLGAMGGRYEPQLVELAGLIEGGRESPYSFEHDRIVQEVTLLASGITW